MSAARQTPLCSPSAVSDQSPAAVRQWHADTSLTADNPQLRARVLEKVEAQIAEIQKRLLKRRDKMDQLGFLSQDNNHARVEAMLKLEIRKRVRVEEIKEVVLSEMWQERAKAEPQEGLFANLEAKLINILDAVGSVETVQKDAQCATVIAPARIPAEQCAAAQALASKAVACLPGCTGIVGVELFLLDDGSLLLNEVAPRPHNSAHYSIEACHTSQFEQQARILARMQQNAAESERDQQLRETSTRNHARNANAGGGRRGRLGYNRTAARA